MCGIYRRFTKLGGGAAIRFVGARRLRWLLLIG
jgi:hypothetical protein